MNVIRSITIVVITGALLAASGCARSRQRAADQPPQEAMQAQAESIQAAGGLAVVGMGSSRTMHLAIEKAKTRGRNELAQLLEARIESMRQAFLAEIGETDGGAFQNLFATAANTLTAQILRSAIPSDMQHETAAGMTTAWMLMAHDPKSIADAFAAQADTEQHPYSQFRASQTFEALEAAIETYEPYRRTL